MSAPACTGQQLIPDPLCIFNKWCKRPRAMDLGSGIMIRKENMTIKQKITKEMNDEWLKVQSEIQDNIEDGFEQISNLFDDPQTDTIISFYFLMFWTRVMSRYGKNGEKHDNKKLIELLTSMMNGNVPRDKDNIFGRETHH